MVSPPLTPPSSGKMLCACGRRRPPRVLPEAPPLPVLPRHASPPPPFVAKVEGFTEGWPRLSAAGLTPEPLMLTIRVPKRTRWAPYDDAHVSVFKEKTRHSLEHMSRLPEGEKRFRAAIIFFNDLIAQPACLASHPSFRQVAINKLEELEAWFKAHPETRYEDEFVETNYQWHELMTELHDHPLYKE
jgi:hypothetical protein